MIADHTLNDSRMSKARGGRAGSPYLEDSIDEFNLSQMDLNNSFDA